MTSANFYKNERLKIFVLICLVFLAYAPVFQAPFKTMDDQLAIVHNEKVHDLSQWPDLFKSSYFGIGDYYRPIVFLSYMLSYHFFGLNPLGYYLVSLILHAITAILVYRLVSVFFEKGSISFFAALLFAVHPIQWVAVSTLTGQNVLLYGSFYIASFLSFYHFLKSKKPALYAGSLILFVLALLSRETAFTLPFLLGSYIMLFRPSASRKKDAQWITGHAVILIVYFIFRKASGFLFLLEQKRSLAEIALSFLTFLKSLLVGLGLIFWPVDLHFDRSTQVFSSFTQGQLIATAVVFMLTAVLIIQNRKKIPKVTLFFIFWIIMDLLPVSQLIAPIRIQPGYISTGDHMFYVSSVGILVLLVSFIIDQREKLAKKISISPNIGRFFLAGVMLFWFFATLKQSIISSSDLALHRQTLAYAPYNMRIRRSYTASLREYGLFEEAEQQYRILLQQDPLNVEFRISLGKSLVDQGKIKEGIEEYEKIQNPGIFADLLKDNLEKAKKLLRKR
ncbi:MAG: hypothetical protein A2Z88_03885 [Omnitrophica WOR_2 bacterium GWA2_47_8]|nr:MAG: hypothetical protein A2Z88_03885 [Omnitrophica WOR_2 bacterium GWA2_47_8]